jgi:outer membrane receptor protein involved in Fe transport
MPDITEGVNRFVFSAGAHYQPASFLTTRMNVGVDYRTNHQRVIEPIGFTPGTVTGELTRFQREFASVSLDVAGTLTTQFADGISSDLTVGAQGFRNEESIVTSNGRDFALPGAPDFDEAAVITSSEANEELFKGGFYVQEEIGIARRLYLKAGYRLDASTTFGDDVGFQGFPKVGVSYILSEEGFFRRAMGRWADELKLRVAYGRTGNQPEPFLRDRTFAAISFRGESAPAPDNPGNTDLRAEVTSTLEAGVDVALLGNRLGLSLTRYGSTTTDALFFVPEQPATGLSTQLRNVGEITNKGTELEVNALVLSTPRVQWSVGASYAVVENEVSDMGGAAPFFVAPQQRVDQGRPVGAWYVTTPFDSNGDGFPDTFREEYTGSQPTPKNSGSLRTTVTLFDRLNIAGLADWATGFQVMDWGSVWATFNGIYRQEIIDSTQYPFPVRYDLSGNPIDRYSESQARSAFIWDGDYLKIREISVSYALPSRLAAQLRASRINVYANIRNVAIFSKNPLIDPELNGVRAPGDLALGGESSITLSPPRMSRLGVEITF